MKDRLDHPDDLQLSVITPMYNEEELIKESAIKLIQAMEQGKQILVSEFYHIKKIEEGVMHFVMASKILVVTM